MGILDIIILCCFLPSLYCGVKNGFVKQVISLVVIILGIKLSIQFSEVVSQWILERVEMQPTWASILSFVVIFLAVALVFGLLGNLIEKILKVTLLGWLNKLLGIVFSLIEVALILSILLYLFNSINNLLDLVSEDVIAESKFYQPLLNLADKIFPTLESLIQK
ncbi:MAG: CvpA family protein [Bacteroidales bacterium]|nr:CvpA family protein [Bacteroidales bacterium]